MADFLFVAGARPNFVKIAPILDALTRAGLGANVVDTGQHYDFQMAGVFFEQLAIPRPAVQLGVGSASHGVQTGRIMAAFDEYLLSREPPRAVVVVGDVNSTVACALVAVKRGIPTVHVEAGLRSFDRTMPEEINRLVTDAIANHLLVSEPAGITNLMREGISTERVHYVGNVMIDSVVRQLDAARALGMTRRFGVESKQYGVVTLHRPSNVDTRTRLSAFVELLVRVASRTPIVFALHPRTEAKLAEFGLRSILDKIATLRLVPALGYHEFLGLVEQGAWVLTDSGGLQEETSYLDVPCLTMRENTERPITVERGSNTLVGDDVALAERLLGEIEEGRYKHAVPIEGWDGRAAERVVEVLVTV